MTINLISSLLFNYHRSTYIDERSQESSQIQAVHKQIREECNISEDMLNLRRKKTEETKSLEKFVEDELQVEIDTNKSLKDAYTRCMKVLLRMLLMTSKVSILYGRRYVFALYTLSSAVLQVQKETRWPLCYKLGYIHNA